MSRIFIKNLPPYLKETELKSEFDKYGNITDVRILFKNNVNRRIAYIGFKYKNEADKVIQERNNSFLGTYKINISLAKLKNDKTQNDQKNNNTNNNIDNSQKIQKYQKFLQQMKIEPDTILIDNIQQKTENEQKIQTKTPVNLSVDYRRLYITNLPFNTNKDEIREVFEKFGEITECKYPIDYNTNKPKGYAFISYSDENNAIKAFHTLDNSIVLGRIIHIKPSYESKFEFHNRNNTEKSSFKKLKKVKLLEKLRDQTNWNSLFLNPNLIIDRISHKLGIQKRDLLDKEFDDLPVKISLAETEIINETKEWLNKNHVNMALFDSNRIECKRSHTIIIVKNLNYDITKNKLDTLFNSYGRVKRLLLADNNAIAIVEYFSEDHCLNVFQNLQDYETYGTKLMLEYAPQDFFLDDITLNKRDQNQQEIQDIQDNTTIYIKNINFNTNEDDIDNMLKQYSLYPKKINLVRKNNLSQGFGFIDFNTIEETQECLKKVQNVILDNHNLQLSISKPKIKDNDNKKFIENLNPTNKILIKNIPFETNKEELRNLIKNYADIKSLRLPKKMDGAFRGFCFVELNNVEDAVLVRDNLSKIHFYGRKLNIEFSNN